MKWREHAMFAAFSPATQDAEIAIAVISENDPVGGGGMAAAPVAGAIIRAYWDLKKKRAELSMGLNSKARWNTTERQGAKATETKLR